MKHIISTFGLLIILIALTTISYGQRVQLQSAIPIDLSYVGYPDEAMKTGLEGRVSVLVEINKKGPCNFGQRGHGTGSYLSRSH